MKNILVLIYMIIVNLVLSTVKIVTGILFMSQSLVVEGIDSLLDSVSNIIGIIAIKHSHKEADIHHPFGHGNSEFIATLLLSVFIIGTSFYLGYELVTGKFVIESKPNMIALIVLLCTTVVKIFVTIYLISYGNKHKNSIIKALGFENASDIPKSLVVIIGVVLSLFNSSIPADKYAGLIVCLLIFISGVKMFFDSYNDLLGKRPDDEVVQQMKETIMTVDGVHNISGLQSLKKGPYYVAIISIVVDGNITVTEGHEIGARVREELYFKLKDLRYVTIHIDSHIQ